MNIPNRIGQIWMYQRLFQVEIIALIVNKEEIFPQLNGCNYLGVVLDHTYQDFVGKQTVFLEVHDKLWGTAQSNWKRLL